MARIPMNDLRKEALNRQATLVSLVSRDIQGEDVSKPIKSYQSSSIDDEELIASLAKFQNEVLPVHIELEDHERQIKFNTYYRPPLKPTAPLLVFHHGAGSSSMTFLTLSKHLLREGYGLFLFDCRGHGSTISASPMALDLVTLVEDFDFVIRQIKKQFGQAPLYLVGHSLGGSVITSYLTKNDHLRVAGIVVIDIVEEPARQALALMPIFLTKRPACFASYRDAIEWHLNSKVLSNSESARLSVVDLLHTEELGVVRWKCDFLAMRDSWDTWFEGLSKKFLECSNGANGKIPKLLTLSSNELLDKELLLGQMQGKYQLVIFNNTKSDSGHFLQEDIPRKLAITVVDFIERYSSYSVPKPRTKWGGPIH